MRITSLTVICTILWALSASQEYTIQMQHIGAHEGLSDNAVHSVAYDPAGYLWIGTEDGLNRYDGFNVFEFNTTNSGLQSDFIEYVTIIENGTLVVLTHFENLPGRIEGLYSMESDRLVRHDAFPPEGLQLMPNRAFYFDGNTLYVLSSGSEVLKYDLVERTWELLTLPRGFQAERFAHGYLKGTFENTDRLIRPGHSMTWISEAGLQVEDPDMALLWRLDDKLAVRAGNVSSQSIVDPFRNLIWILYGEFLTAVDTIGDFVRFSEDPSVVAFPRNVMQLVFGPDGTMYLATLNGIYIIRIQPQRFRTFASTEAADVRTGLSALSTRGIAEYDGALYVAEDNKLYRQDLRGDERPRLLLERTSGRFFPVWISGDTLLAARNSLYLFDLRTLESRILIDTIDAEVAPVWAVYKKHNTLYLGGQDGVVALDFAKLLRGSTDFKCVHGLLQFRYCYQLLDIGDTGFFYVTTDGLYVSRHPDGCDPEPVHFSYPDGAPVSFRRFTSLWNDPDSTFWTTSLDGGLIHFRLLDREAVVLNELNRDDGLPSNTMYAVYPDDFGSMWISTDLGLVQLNKTDWSYRIYTTEDGLPNDEFNRISHERDDAGNLYFGGLGGVVALTPSDFYSGETDTIPLRLLSCTQHIAWNDTIVDMTEAARASYRSDGAFAEPLTFHPGDKFMRFEVGLQDFFRTNAHQYEYRIEGLHEGWQVIRGNTISITVLPYGKHLLEIRAKDAHGRYSGQRLHFGILAKRPFYLQWWFFLVVGLGVMLTIREYLVSRTRRIRNLERIVGERTEEIARQNVTLIELQQARSRFFANISHELRTPLTLIKGPVESLLKKDYTEEDLKYLQIIQYNTKQLQKRIEDLLSLSKADSGHLTTQRSAIKLNAFLERLIDMFSGKATEQRIVLQLRNDLPASALVQTDAGKLEQILTNFLSNALKYSPQGSNVSLQCSPAGECIRFCVSDTGPGIAPADQEKVFERFYQANHAKGGSGIGLALSKEFARALEGNVWVESAPGEGSQFYLEIPWIKGYEVGPDAIEPAPETAVGAVQETGPESTPSRHAPTLLIVEDNPAMRTFLSLELKQFHVVTAEDGMDALEQLQRMKKNASLPDLILSDVMMPRMDGFELLQRIKDEKQFASIPVIMLTARAEMTDKIGALRIGVHDYITKPFDSEELRVRIGNLLGRKPDKQQAANESPEVTTVDHVWLRELESRILNQMSDSSFTVSRLALDMHISESQLHRRLKAFTGLTPGKYLREVRLHRARELMESGEAFTVASLSAAAGFEDPDYFSRIYMERFGYRPSERM